MIFFSVDGVSESKACWLNTKYDFIVKKLQFDYGVALTLLYYTGYN